MMKSLRQFIFFSVLAFFFSNTVFSQGDSPVFPWKVTSKKVGDGKYELVFSTIAPGQWELYAPVQKIDLYRVLYEPVCFLKYNMMKSLRQFIFFSVLAFFFSNTVFSQGDSPVFPWKVTSKKVGDGKYELVFSTIAPGQWELYAPVQKID